MTVAKRALTALLTFLTLCALISSCGMGSSSAPLIQAEFRKGPYLIYSNDNSKMTVMWQTDMTPSSESKIEWGTTNNYSAGSANVTENGRGTNEHLFSYTIDGLSAGSYTYYRVTVDGTSQTGSFKTAPDSDASSVTFYAYGDTRSDPRAHNTVARQMMANVASDAGNRQTVCLHGGDFVLYGLTEAYWDEEFFDRDYPYMMELLAKIPIMPAMGNHEMYMEPPFDTDYENEHAGELLRKYWPIGIYDDKGSVYYSFDYGPVHIAVVDQYTTDFDLSSDQYAWLENDLSSSEKPWKIVMYHAPGWGASSSDDTDVRALTTRNDLGPLFAAQGIPLIIQGHHHYYSRSDVDGITYLVLGGGGAPLSEPETSYDYVVKAQKAYHFARFDVLGADTMSAVVIDSNGNEIDSFTIAQ